jgi:hypothetical protein
MTLTDIRNATECRTSTRHYAAIRDAIAVYDYLGGLGNDAVARETARRGLEAELSLSDMDAARLLAGALARRATLRRNEP